MFRFTSAIALGLALAGAGGAALAGPTYPKVGRTATPAELAAWDIDVRPDFKGLPPGSGSVQNGQKIWESTCAGCHGTFAESNQVFTPIVGGTTADDIKTGHVAALRNNSQPQRTTLMKVATISTLWDYIHRAMPWNAPKSLSNDDVYGVLAYILNLGDIVPDDYVLSNKNIAEVQKRMPNRNGMSFYPGLWNVHGKPDVRNVACMKNCATEVKIASVLPDIARGSHGNLADQNRPIGEVRGQNTAVAAPAHAKSEAPAPNAGAGLIAKYSCVACHGVTNKIVGPGFADVAARYKGKAGAEAQLMAKIRHGGSGNWGDTPMPPQAEVSDADLKTIVDWVLAGAH
jgi:S-disulfanyl-L-cysteine oxidoreductase SoxD